MPRPSSPEVADDALLLGDDTHIHPERFHVQQLGATRSVSTATHSLQTPDTFVRIRLPGMSHAMAIVHASPANGARFAQYTVEMEEEGEVGPTSAQRFVYVLNGTVTVTIAGQQRTL